MRSLSSHASVHAWRHSPSTKRITVPLMPVGPTARPREEPKLRREQFKPHMFDGQVLGEVDFEQAFRFAHGKRIDSSIVGGRKVRIDERGIERLLDARRAYDDSLRL